MGIKSGTERRTNEGRQENEKEDQHHSEIEGGGKVLTLIGTGQASIWKWISVASFVPLLYRLLQRAQSNSSAMMDTSDVPSLIVWPMNATSCRPRKANCFSGIVYKKSTGASDT